MLKYIYESAEIEVKAIRKDKPPMVESIEYHIKIYGASEHLNPTLLKKKLEKFGTIYNTLKVVCPIQGEIELM